MSTGVPVATHVIVSRTLALKMAAAYIKFGLGFKPGSIKYKAAVEQLRRQMMDVNLKMEETSDN